MAPNNYSVYLLQDVRQATDTQRTERVKQTFLLNLKAEGLIIQ